jgi:hypothetical protein
MTATAIAPAVLAPEDALRCGEKHPNVKGVSCDRKFGHPGGHLSRVPETYWQAEEAGS